jgi:hypothetical protein
VRFSGEQLVEDGDRAAGLLVASLLAAGPLAQDRDQLSQIGPSR